MCNNNSNNEEETDNLYFLTSLKNNEISQMKLKNNLLGFQLITHIGLTDISTDKFHKDSLNYEKELNSPLIENLFEKELNETAENLLQFLKDYCKGTEERPLPSAYNPFYYKLIIQKRQINEKGINKFKELLNLGVKIHRFSTVNNNIIENNETF